MNDDFSRPDREGRSGPNVMMWVVLVATLVGLLGIWCMQHLKERLKFSDLQALIAASALNEKGELADNSKGFIDVPDAKTPEKFVRYSGLKDIVVGDTDVIGLVSKQAYQRETKDGKEELVPVDKEARELAFTTRKQTTDNELLSKILT